MPNPLLTALPDCTETTFLRSLIATVKSDPILVAAGVAFWEATGIREQTPPSQGQGGFFVPCYDDILNGLVEFIAGDVRSDRETEHAHKASWDLTINCYSPGLHENDSLNLCAAVRKSLFSVLADSNLNNTPELCGRPKLTVAGKQQMTLGQSRYGIKRTMVLNVRFLFKDK